MKAAVTRRQRTAGREGGKAYSLIEILIVLAIIGLIASIAYPSYRSYMADTYKARAAVDLMVCSLALEAFHANGFTYEGADEAGVCALQSPREGKAHYTISYRRLTRTDFRIRATPIDGACGTGDCVEVTADGTRSEL